MLTSSYPKFQGDVTAPFIEEIAAGLAARGHETHVVLPRHRDLRHGELERGVHLYPYSYAPVRALNVWGYAESLAADVNLRSRVYAAAMLALPASMMAVKRVVRRQSCDLVHAHWVIPNGPPAALAAAACHRPLAISLHGSDIYLPERHSWLRGITSWAFRKAAVITACSSDLARRAEALGAPADRIVVIPYGADPVLFHPAEAGERQRVRAEWKAGEGEALVLAIGRLVRKKGLDQLIRAMPGILRDAGAVRLVIAGDGDLRSELSALASELGVEKQVVFAGAVGRERLPSLLRCCDVLAVPSMHDEQGNVDGLPNVVLEGMASGAAIVASNVVGIPQVITSGEHGLLVPEQDPAALTATIVRLLKEPGLRVRLGQAARRRVEESLNWSSVARQFEAACIRALG